MNPTGLPELFKPSRDFKNLRKTEILETKVFRKNRKKYFLGSRHAQLAIYTVFDEESESEVKKCQILEPGGKI